MNWTAEQIKNEIGNLEFEFGIPAGEYLAIVKRESQNFVYQGRLHPDGVSKGLAGITKGAIQEYEDFTGNSFPDYMENSANLRVGAWYWGVRVPQLIKHFDKPVNLVNKVIAYNAGISYVANGTPFDDLPEITKNYVDYMQELPRYKSISDYIGLTSAVVILGLLSGLVV